MSRKRVVVIGGGLAGLSAASLLTQKGYQVTLLEKMGQVGGRCSMIEKEGFRLNFGAHAVYGRERSYMLQVIKQLGLDLTWVTMDPRKVRYEMANNELATAPIDLQGLWNSKLFPSYTEKLAFLRALSSILLHKGDGAKNKTLKEWLQTKPWNQAVKHFLLHLAGTNFFTSEPEQLQAETFIQYYKRIFRASHPVSYIRGGWSALVEGLTDYLNKSGATILTKTGVNQIICSETLITGVIAGKELIEAEAFIFCIPPVALRKLVANTPLAEQVTPFLNEQPNSALIYDIALSERIRGDVAYFSDMENHLFITDPSLYDPSCAPPQGQLLQAVAYLAQGDSQRPEVIAAQLERVEAMYDRHYPGWRDRLVFKRVTEQATVQAVSLTGNPARLPVHFEELPNCFFAGDWCDAEGSVSDVAFHSSLQAVGQL